MCDNVDLKQQERSCRCHKAVMTGYAAMKNAGAAECEALDAAYRVYRYHHPECGRETSRVTVERWVYAGQSH